MKKKFSFLFILLAVELALLVFKPFYGWSIRALLAPTPGISSSGSGVTAENEMLKAKVAELESIKAQIPQKTEKYTRAIVYSRYPFNFKNELLLNVGSKEGILKGKAVTFGGVLIGKVENVFEETSLVETVFNDSFQLAVRIGTGGVQALLTGGSTVSLGLISGTATVQKGDIVYSAAAGFPYGLPLGEIDGVRVSDDKLFQVATLAVPYDTGDIATVLIAQ